MRSKSYRWLIRMGLPRATTGPTYQELISTAGGTEAIRTKICMSQSTSRSISLKYRKTQKWPLYLTCMATVGNFTVFSMATPAKTTQCNLEYILCCVLSLDPIWLDSKIAHLRVSNLSETQHECSWVCLTRRLTYSLTKFHFSDTWGRTKRKSTSQWRIWDSWDKYWADRSISVREAERYSQSTQTTKKSHSTRSASTNSEVIET